MIFDTVEDFIEYSVNLNFEARTLLQGVKNFLTTKDFVSQELEETLAKLDYFAEILDNLTIEDSEGNKGINLSDFKSREVH